ncbi:MAG: hypothetical protein DWQ10_04540 [Calditrichaeota bacterium]|nr:MAG: hypothetical protein DWQ10_04540 [Calditrichota bacterium]
MTGYERITSVLNGEWPDKRPVMLHNFMMAAQEEGLSMKEFRDVPEKAARAFINAAEKYDTDGILIDIDTATLAGAVGVPVDYPQDEPARPHGSRIASLEEADDLPDVDIAKDGGVQRWLEVSRTVKNYFGDEKFVRGNCDQAPFSLASMIRGAQEFMSDLLIDVEGVHTLLNYAMKASGQFIRLMAETGVDMVSNGDSVAGPEMISPQSYRAFAFPYEKKLVETAHELGLPYALHICGDTSAILPDMLQTGADALELDYLTDPALIYKYCHDRILFIGNIDPSGVLHFGDEKLVAEKVNELLHIYRTSPRLLVNAGCAIPPETPSVNVKMLVNTTRDAI